MRVAIREKKALNSKTVEILTSLIQQGRLQEETLAYCQQIDLKDLNTYESLRPVLQSLYTQGKGEDVNHLFDFSSKNDFLEVMKKTKEGEIFVKIYKELTYVIPEALINALKTEIDHQASKLLFNEESRNELMLQMANLAIFSDKSYLQKLGADTFKLVVKQNPGAKAFINLVSELMKRNAENNAQSLEEDISKILDYKTTKESYQEIFKTLIQMPYTNPNKENDKLYFGLLLKAFRQSNLDSNDLSELIIAVRKRLDAVPPNEWEEKIDLDVINNLCDFAIKNKVELGFVEKFTLESLQSGSIKSRIKKTEIIEELIESGGSLETAVKAVETLMNINPSDKIDQHRLLWESLILMLEPVKAGLGLNLALDLIKRSLEEPDANNMAAKLLESLLDQKLGTQLAIPVISKMVPGKSFFPYENLLAAMIRNGVPLTEDLLAQIKKQPHIEYAKALLANNQSIDLVIEIVKTNLPNPKMMGHSDSEKLSLVTELVKMGYAFDLGIDVAKKYITTHVGECRSVVFDILQALSAKGQYQVEAKAAAQIGHFDSVQAIRQKSYQILNT